MTYNRWTGRVPRISPCRVEDLDSRPARMDYINGASTLASRSFLEKIGLMEESYFLYFEEMDWAMRARGKFALGYARDSVIYHKEGATIGTNLDRRKRSLLSDQYLSRNRVLFTRRFVPWALPTVFDFRVPRRCRTVLHWGCQAREVDAFMHVTWPCSAYSENGDGNGYTKRLGYGNTG